MSKLEVLCATMHQTDFSLVKKMNVSTDIIFANQADATRHDEVEFDGYKAKMFTTNTRGLGVNRNVTLMYATGDICLFADDDIVYANNYQEIITNAFKVLPDADAIIFDVNLIGMDKTRREHTEHNSAIKKIHYLNCLKYATIRMSIKTDIIKRENILFHTLFGSGARYTSGEDTLFIWNMLKHKMKIYAYPAVIADVHQESSTWFDGYNEKFLFDKGALYRALSKPFAKLLCLQALIRHSYMYKQAGLSFIEAYRIMKHGARAYVINQSYSEFMLNNKNK